MAKAEMLLPDFPSGPLDRYRKNLPFDWKSLKIHFLGEELLRYQMHVWSRIQEEPELAQPEGQLSLEQERTLAYKRAKKLAEMDLLPPEEVVQSPRKGLAFLSAVGKVREFHQWKYAKGPR